MKPIDFRIFRTNWIPDFLPIGSLWLETSATALCGPYVIQTARDVMSCDSCDFLKPDLSLDLVFCFSWPMLEDEQVGHRCLVLERWLFRALRVKRKERVKFHRRLAVTAVSLVGWCVMMWPHHVKLELHSKTPGPRSCFKLLISWHRPS